MTDDEIFALAEPFGAFEFGDAQGGKRLGFARAVLAAAGTVRQPLNDEQALVLARRHLDKGLSWAPHITRCNDLEIRALIRAIEAAHGIRA